MKRHYLSVSAKAVTRPVFILGCERSLVSVPSPQLPRANPQKRGTLPTTMFSTFTQVKNQTFSFHFFQLGAEG